MKYLFSIFFIVFCNVVFAQHQKITQLLNKQLQREYAKFYTDEEKAKFSVLQDFYIDENKVLHFGFVLVINDIGDKIHIERQVPLEKIVLFDKDQNVYFYTLNKDVIETQNDYDSNGKLTRTTTEYSNYFVTEINKEHHPNRFMKNVIKAFKKAGYAIECSYLKN